MPCLLLLLLFLSLSLFLVRFCLYRSKINFSYLFSYFLVDPCSYINLFFIKKSSEMLAMEGGMAEKSGITRYAWKEENPINWERAMILA